MHMRITTNGWDAVLILLAVLAFLTGSPAAIVPALVLFTVTVLWRALGRIADAPMDVDSSMPVEDEPSARPWPEEVAKKHPQFILAMAAEFFDNGLHFQRDVNRVPASDFLGWPETASSLHIAERNMLEENPRFRQVLPYVVVRATSRGTLAQLLLGPQETRYLVYQRGKGVGESRLAGKVSIGFGGHIDAADVLFDNASVLNLNGTILASASREVEEELQVDGQPISAPVLKYADIFLTHNEGVQRVHLGVVMFLDTAPGETLECAEPELATLGMHTAEQILYMAHTGLWDLEVWTRLLLEEFVVAG